MKRSPFFSLRNSSSINEWCRCSSSCGSGSLVSPSSPAFTSSSASLVSLSHLSGALSLLLLLLSSLSCLHRYFTIRFIIVVVVVAVIIIVVIVVFVPASPSHISGSRPNRTQYTPFNSSDDCQVDAFAWEGTRFQPLWPCHLSSGLLPFYPIFLYGFFNLNFYQIQGCYNWSWLTHYPDRCLVIATLVTGLCSTSFARTQTPTSSDISSDPLKRASMPRWLLHHWYSWLNGHNTSANCQY